MERDAGLNVDQRLAALGPAFADVEAMDHKARTRLGTALALDVAVLAGAAAAVHLGGGDVISPLALILGGTLALVLAGATALVAYAPAWDSEDAFRGLRERALGPFLAGFTGGAPSPHLARSFDRGLHLPGVGVEFEVDRSYTGLVGAGACTMTRLVAFQPPLLRGNGERKVRFDGTLIAMELEEPVGGFVRVRRDRFDWFHGPLSVGLARARDVFWRGIQLGRSPGRLVKLAGAEFERVFEVHASDADLAHAVLDRRLQRALRELGQAAPSDVTVTLNAGHAYVLLEGVDFLSPGVGTFRRGLGGSARAMRRELALVMAIWRVLEALAAVGEAAPVEAA